MHLIIPKDIVLLVKMCGLLNKAGKYNLSVPDKLVIIYFKFLCT
jgi:hypothetical protein